MLAKLSIISRKRSSLCFECGLFQVGLLTTRWNVIRQLPAASVTRDRESILEMAWFYVAPPTVPTPSTHNRTSLWISRHAFYTDLMCEEHPRESEMTTAALLHERHNIDTSIRGARCLLLVFRSNSLNRERHHPHSHYHRLTLQQHAVAARFVPFRSSPTCYREGCHRR